jgi:hypothetical protein
MAEHELISTQLNILAVRLPAPAVDELADGLYEAYETQLAEHRDPDAAAHLALAQFGDADTVTAAFIRHSPWRRTALALLATGPLIGALCESSRRVRTLMVLGPASRRGLGVDGSGPVRIRRG